MAGVTLLVPGPSPSPHRQVTITSTDGGVSFTVPLLSSIGIDDVASRWSIQDRPGREPMTVWGGPGAVTGSLTIRIGDDLSRSVEADLLKIRTLALGSKAIVVACGQFSRWSWTGTWVITSCQVGDQLLLQGSNEVAQATVTLNLTAAMTPEQIRATGR